MNWTRSPTRPYTHSLADKRTHTHIPKNKSHHKPATF